MNIATTDVRALRWLGDTLRISVRLGLREHIPTDAVIFTIRSRRGARSFSCTNTHLTVAAQSFDTTDVDAVFDAHTQDLWPGIWDIWVQIHGDDGAFETRVRTNRFKSDYELHHRVDRGLRQIRPYDTADGELSLQVAEVHQTLVQLDRVSWDGDTLVAGGFVREIHGVDVAGARAIWPAVDREERLEITKSPDGRVAFRHRLRPRMPLETEARFEWQISDFEGRSAWVPVSLSAEQPRSSHRWTLPISGKLSFSQSVWLQPRFDKSSALTLGPSAPIVFSITKAVVPSFLALHADVRVVCKPQPLGMRTADVVSLDEAEDIRLIWMETAADVGQHIEVARLSPKIEQAVRVSPPVQESPPRDAEYRLGVSYSIRGRKFIAPMQVTSPAARRKYPGFAARARPAVRSGGRWHALFIGGDGTLHYVRRRRHSSEKMRTRAKDLFAATVAQIAGTVSSREVWLVGENLGTVAQDNGVCFFEHCVNSRKPEKILYVARSNCRHWDRLSANAESVLRHNSFSHYYHFHRSNRLVVTHGIRDVLPSLHHRRVNSNRKSVVYLQHGITALKRIYYSNTSYNGRIDAFVVASEYEKSLLVKHNGFAPERLTVTGFPRYDRLIPSPSTRTLLIMPTWREWIMRSENDFRHSQFLATYGALLSDPEVLDALRIAKARIRFFPHVEIENRFRHLLDFASERVEVCSYSDTDVQSELRSCDGLLTDYSSVAWDALYLRKPVVFFHFDADEYEQRRGSYIDLAKLPGKIVRDTSEARDAMIELLSRPSAPNASVDARAEKFFAYRDQGNSERVYRAVRRLSAWGRT